MLVRIFPKRVTYFGFSETWSESSSDVTLPLNQAIVIALRRQSTENSSGSATVYLSAWSRNGGGEPSSVSRTDPGYVGVQATPLFPDLSNINVPSFMLLSQNAQFLENLLY
jgi:hypothetical protein